MLILDSLQGIYCDALVDDNEFLIFASLWGRDTAIQELLARLSLPLHEGGLSQLEFSSPTVPTLKEVIHIGNPDRLDKLTGRMPKANIFGDIVQLCLFDKRAITPDYINRQAYLLCPNAKELANISADSVDITEKTWQLVKSVCHLPMLDLWQVPIMNLLRDQNWLTTHQGYAINSISIHLPETEFDETISQMIKNGQLLLEPPQTIGN